MIEYDDVNINDLIFCLHSLGRSTTPVHAVLAKKMAGRDHKTPLLHVRKRGILGADGKFIARPKGYDSIVLSDMFSYYRPLVNPNCLGQRLSWAFAEVGDTIYHEPKSRDKPVAVWRIVRKYFRGCGAAKRLLLRQVGRRFKGGRVVACGDGGEYDISHKVLQYYTGLA